MRSKLKLAALAIGLAALVAPMSANADMIYTYTGNNSGSHQYTVSLRTTLSGAALDNLPAGTDISASLVSFSMSDGGAPSTDTAGFPEADFSLTAPGGATVLPGNVIQIGTNALGNITSWNINESYF